jgi:hypothetical protein
MRIVKAVSALAAIVGIFISHGQNFLTDGLIGYYPFNANANDESGRGNNMVLNGGTLTTNRFGKPAAAFSFNGISDFMGATHRINDVTNSFTISVWFNSTQGVVGPAVPETGIPALLFPSQGTQAWGDDSAGVGLGVATNRIIVMEHAALYDPYVIAKDGDFVGWTHVVLVYSNKVPSLFVNGVLVGTGTESPKGKVRPSNGETESTFGYVGGFGGVTGATAFSFFRGQIDDVRYYNRALSAQEALDLFVFESDRPPALGIRIKTVEVNLHVVPTRKYQIQSSLNLVTWTNLGNSFVANTSEINQEFDVTEVGQFFRIQEVP